MNSLTFLGTASALGIPHLFCDCRICRRAIRMGGHEIRSRTSLAIGRRHRVDFNADSQWQYASTGIPAYELEHLLLTHSHLDHIDINQVMLRYPPYNAPTIPPKLTVYGNPTALARFTADPYQAARLKASRIVLKDVSTRRSFKAGEMRVHPIRVFHSKKEQCLNYVIEYRGRTIYVGNDQKYTFPEELPRLARFRFDVAIFEGSLGDAAPVETHMTFSEMIAWKNQLVSLGAITPRTRCFATHFSHRVTLTHDRIVKRLAPHGIVPAHDGLVVRL